MGQKDKIGFADEQYNPVRGCLNTCPYCFARKNNKRFPVKTFTKEFNYRIKESHNIEYRGDVLKDNIFNFKPEIIYSQLEKKFKKSSTHIFVNSMSDICYWTAGWFKLVFDWIAKYPDKKFIFFTKDYGKDKKHDYPDLFLPLNTVLIYTINTYQQYKELYIDGTSTQGICIEPMQSSFELLHRNLVNNYLKWVIIGGETGNRKGKIEVQKEWLEPFYDLKIPVYMKESIRHLVPADKFRQERI